MGRCMRFTEATPTKHGEACRVHIALCSDALVEKILKLQFNLGTVQAASFAATDEGPATAIARWGC